MTKYLSIMCVIVLFVVIVCITKFSDSYNIDVLDENSYHYKKVQDDQGNYQYVSYIFPTGTKGAQLQKETGTVEGSKSNQDDNNFKVQGEYSYSDNIYVYKVTYVADEKGFRAHVEKKIELGDRIKEDEISSAAISSLQGFTVG